MLALIKYNFSEFTISLDRALQMIAEHVSFHLCSSSFGSDMPHVHERQREGMSAYGN